MRGRTNSLRGMVGALAGAAGGSMTRGPLPVVNDATKKIRETMGRRGQVAGLMGALQGQLGSLGGRSGGAPVRPIRGQVGPSSRINFGSVRGRPIGR